MLKKLICLSLIFSSNLFAAEQASEDDLWGDDFSEEETGESENPWTGFVEAGYGYRTKTDPLFSNQETLHDIKIYLEKNQSFENAEVIFKGEGWYDGVLNGFEGDVRELSLNFSLFENTDFKIGRQISTWGTGDLVFLNDQFPKGWNGYFNGLDDVYVKAPANAVRINSFFESFNLNFIWTPEFTSDDYINGENFAFFSPQVGEPVGGQNVIDAKEPTGGEYALRLYKNIAGTEYALYGYKGFEKRPLGATQELQPTHHKKVLYGASVRGNLWDGLYNIEYSHENAQQDKNGTNALVNNSVSKWLVGYEMELFPKFNISFQYYLERIENHDALIANSPYPQYETKRNRVWLTNRIRYSAMQDKLTWNLFSFYSPTEKDYFLRWNVNYRQNDNWSYTLGLNHIDGEQEHTFFAQFKKASNVYARVRYNF